MAHRRRVAGPTNGAGTALVGLVVCVGVGLLCGLLNGIARRRAARAPVHRHAGHDVGAARHRVRREQGREHPRADVAHRGDEGVARTRRRALSRADAGDARRHGRSGAIYLTRTVMGRHIFAFGGNLEASRFAGLLTVAHPDRRVRRLGTHGRDSRRSSARASTARRLPATRRATSCTSSRRRSSAARVSSAAREARSARCSARC